MQKNNSPRILMITQLYPSGSTGTSVKTRYTLETLTKYGFTIDVCCTHFEKMIKVDMKNPNIHFFTVPKETVSKLSLAYFKRAWVLLLSPIPFRVIKLYDQKLADQLDKLKRKHTYSFIFFDGFSTLQYTNTYADNNMYIDDEDITDLMWKRYKTTKNIFIKLFFLSEWIKCKRVEKIFFKNVAQIWAISKNTQARFKKISHAPVYRMPTIIPLQQNIFRPSSRHIVFSGLLSWLENTSGLVWFLENCWPTIHQAFPETILYVTGQMADPGLISYMSRFPGVQHVGFVPNLADIYKTCALAISPIFINSGIKVKVVTYLSYGLPVVSSTEATWGLESTEGIVSSSQKRFAASVCSILSDTSKRHKLSKMARHNIQTNHSEKVLLSFFKKKGII
jgi:hypothetical protein